eukprot:5939366-Prymnesium_polylepis.1
MATEIFEASHVAPERTVAVCERIEIAISDGLEAHVRLPLVEKYLPPVRCGGLWIFDNSSGHGKATAGALNAGACHKGPDWAGKVVPMRDGWYVDADGKRQVQRMQFEQGDLLPGDLTIPLGIDPDAAAAGEVRPPR